jgi:hypothetical protein
MFLFLKNYKMQSTFIKSKFYIKLKELKLLILCIIMVLKILNQYF